MAIAVALPNYTVSDPFYECDRFIFFHGKRNRDSLPVILKFLKENRVHPRSLKHEYEILQKIDSPYVLKAYDFQLLDHQEIIILENFEWNTLASLLERERVSIKDFLMISIALARGLGEIHDQHMIHKNITPQSILINAASNQIKFFDFSLATLLPYSVQPFVSFAELEGNLPYLSPEQTGRINRIIDYRTDLYALGVTLYKMLTGKLPFQANRSSKILELNLIEEASSPHEINADIPEALSKIVMKCMAKEMEERYHTAHGLEFDLSRCLTELSTTGSIETFSLDRWDVFDHFQIPQKLYERKTSMSVLLTAVEQCTQGHSQLLLFNGGYGVGKSSIVSEIQKEILKKNGCFTQGIFDPLTQKIPYKGWKEALTHLIDFYLIENESAQHYWKKKILGSLGRNARLMIDLIPELEKLIGALPEVEQLDPLSAEIRFDFTFTNFIQIFLQRAPPLVIALDNLEWADIFSLKLIHLLMSDQSIENLLIIGTYHLPENSIDSPLEKMIAKIRNAPAEVSICTVDALSRQAIAHLLIETLNSTFLQVADFSEWMYEKTQGNPLFAIQLLKMLYRESLIQFLPSEQRWKEDLPAIKVLAFPETLPHFISFVFQRLSQTTQSLLSLASIIGTTFDLQTLAFLYKKSLSETAQDLWEALQEELILSQQIEYAIDFKQNFEKTPIRYTFLHNALRLAAYQHLDEEKKQEIYEAIGLLKFSQNSAQGTDEELENGVFFLNRAHSHVALQSSTHRSQDPEILAQLNLIAGKKALNLGASDAAFSHFNTGIEILLSNHSQNRRLNYELYQHKLECQQLFSHWDYVEDTFHLALGWAENVEEKTLLYCSMISWAGKNNLYYNALKLTKEALELYHISFEIPVSYAKIFYLRIVAEMTIMIRNFKGISLPEPDKNKAVSHIYHALTYSFIHMTPLIMEKIILEETITSFQSDLHETSAVAMMARAYFLCGELQGNYEKGYRLGLKVRKILEHLPKLKLTTQGLAIFYTSIVFWKQSLKKGHTHLIRLRQECLATGDIRYAIHCATALSSLLLLRGDPLESVYKEIQSIHSSLGKYKRASVSIELIFLEVCESLMGISKSGNPPLSDPFDISFNSMSLGNSLSINLHADYWRVFLFYLGDKFESAISLADIMNVYISLYPSHLYWQPYSFYYALSLTAICNENEKKERYWPTLKKLQKKLQIWATICPVNFLHQHLLLEAEMARLTNAAAAATQLYEKAIAAATKNDYLQDAAIANELTAKFYLQLNINRMATYYMKEAYRLYGKWGAIVKLSLLRKKYHDLLSNVSLMYESDLIDYPLRKSLKSLESSITTASPGKNFDINAVIQSTQEISKEISLNPLVTKFMKLIFSKIHAEKILFLMQKNQHWNLYAEMNKEHAIPKFTEFNPISANRERLSLCVIFEVEQSKSECLLNDTSLDYPIKNDPYLEQSGAKSLLAMPLIHRGKLLAILYLENKLIKNAFTLEGVRFLQLLCTQTAISIENVFLYAALDQKVHAHSKKLILLQGQLVQQEKMASLGLLAAGIAHEIRNPLNFIINFSELSLDLVGDLKHLLSKKITALSPELNLNLEETVNTVQSNLKTVNEQGNRADSIVKKMSAHATGKPGEMAPTAIRQLLEESIALSYHGMRARDPSFNVAIEKKFDQSIDILQIAPQEISRVILNLLNNSYYAVMEKKKQGANPYTPLITITTRNLGHEYEICIRDNGIGIPAELTSKIFTPFFTTKPKNEGTGLGIILSQNVIVQQHGGTMTFNTLEGEFTEFIIRLPMSLSRDQ